LTNVVGFSASAQAALGFATLLATPHHPVLTALHGWPDSWRGIGDVVMGMHGAVRPFCYYEGGSTMAAYVIANLNVHDAATFEEYRKQVPATIAKHGGRYLVRGGRMERVEGSWNPTRLVVLEFPSMEQARRWYDSEEYREPKAIRMKSAVTDAVFVEGF